MVRRVVVVLAAVIAALAGGTGPAYAGVSQGGLVSEHPVRFSAQPAVNERTSSSWRAFGPFAGPEEHSFDEITIRPESIHPRATIDRFDAVWKRGELTEMWHDGGGGGFETTIRRYLVPDLTTVILCNIGDFEFDSIEQAIRNAVQRAGQTLRRLDWFEVTEIRGHIVDGQIGHFQVGLKVGFQLEEPTG